MEGYGHPFYVGAGYGIKRNPPLIAVENSPVGSYKRTFNVPANWKGKQIVLHFGGVASAFYVWVNGERWVTRKIPRPPVSSISPPMQ